MRMIVPLVAIACLVNICGQAAQAKETTPLNLVFACSSDNDLYRVVTAAAGALPRYGTAAEAVEKAPGGAGLLILADGYPAKPTAVSAATLKAASRKHLRLYIEYPASLPGLEIGAARSTEWERAVVATDAFGAALPKLRILAIHDCRFQPVQATSGLEPLIVEARVAGFDTAVYGLPEAAAPVLFRYGDRLIATTKLSGFVTGRYAPTEAWETIWQWILASLCPDQAVPALKWTPTVRPSFDAKDRLPADAESQAFRRGSKWFINSGLLATSSSDYELAKTPVGGPTDLAQTLVGPGSHGIFEGYGSHVRWDGSQPQQTAKRGDCNGESAMGIAVGAVADKDPERRRIAQRMLDYWFFRSIAQQGIRADPKHPTFGLSSWGISNYALERAFYGDDAARLMLGTVATGALLKTDRWDDSVVKCLLGNLRTTGRLGFRYDRIDIPELETNGWRWYFDGSPVSYAPHYEAYLWACYLWAYKTTGYKLFLDRAETAVRLTMAAYPDDWRWTNGTAQEKARMLLPLAWLVRVDDTPEHRQWLRRVAQDLIRLQAPSGAIREEIGASGMGQCPPPASNADYGVAEASLLQQNGDPVCDLLYTTNFALLGLHEAAAATGERLYADAETKLARFLCRIQVKSEARPELDGAWFRAFDFNRWEYWASDADLGWGVWSIETGWTQGWITGVLGMRQMKTSLWDLTAGRDLKATCAKWQPLFFPDGDQPQGPPPLKHLALGKPVKLAHPWNGYSGGGDDALTDGRVGKPDYRDSAWQGFEGPDLDAVIDLGKPTRLHAVKSNYLQQTGLGIWLPRSVEYAVSDDGVEWRIVATAPNDMDDRVKGPVVKSFEAQVGPLQARFLRVRAKSIGIIPDWHPAKGKKAWLFVDEVIVK